MSGNKATPWVIGGVVSVLLFALAGYAIGSGAAMGKSDADQARDEGYKTTYERTFKKVEAVSMAQGLKAGRSRGRRAGVKTGGREGTDLGGGIAGYEDAKNEAVAAEAATAAAQAETAERQANCGSIPEAPDICPTNSELSAYQGAVEALNAPVTPEVPGNVGQ